LVKHFPHSRPVRTNAVHESGGSLSTAKENVAARPKSRVRALHANVELLIVYHKPPEQMPAFYSASDVLLLTSDWEGSPNVVKEALACDLPVVSVPVGDVEERIRGLPACSICPRDASALAVAVDAALRQQRPDSLRPAVSELDTPKIAWRLLEIYREVVEGGRRGNHRSRDAERTAAARDER